MLNMLKVLEMDDELKFSTITFYEIYLCVVCQIPLMVHLLPMLVLEVVSGKQPDL